MEILAQSSANFALTLLFGHSYIMGASRGGPCDSTALVEFITFQFIIRSELWVLPLFRELASTYLFFPEVIYFLRM